MNEELDIWNDFVAEHFPGYYQSDEIAHEGDLFKLVEKEYDHEDCAYNLLMKKYDGDINNPQIKIDWMEQYIEVLEGAIEGYLESVKTK